MMDLPVLLWLVSTFLILFCYSQIGSAYAIYLGANFSYTHVLFSKLMLINV